MIAIIGKGGFAKEVAQWIKQTSFKDRAVEFYVSPGYGDKQISEIPKRVPAVIAIGDPRQREKVSANYIWYAKLAHETVVVGDNVTIGEGCILCPYSVITVDCKIGDHLHMNLHSDIGHDCTIGNFVTLSPGARVSGNCNIGNCVYIGSNAVIREGVTICDDVTIGAGAVVLNDITESGTYVGMPAKKK